MTSLRRKKLDNLLLKNLKYMKGHVLDIGGHKFEKRGNFLLPKENIIKWDYLNIDESKRPDILADIETYKLEQNKYDTVLLIEVIEYIDNLENLLKNIYQSLKNNSYLIISAPLFNSLHGDFEYDKMRYSEIKLKKSFSNVGFSIIKFNYMGGLGSVLHDFLRSYFMNSNKRIMIKTLFLFKFIFVIIDYFTSKNIKYINTGYFFILKK